MATEQELKPALNPFVQSLLNLQGGGLDGLLQGINPSLENDPVFQSLKSLGGFTKDMAEDPLTYIGGGGPKLASAYLIARAKKMEDVKKFQNIIKREENNIARSTDPNEIQGASRAVANARKKLKTLVDSIRKSDAKEGVIAGKKPVADSSSPTGRSDGGLASMVDEAMYGPSLGRPSKNSITKNLSMTKRSGEGSTAKEEIIKQIGPEGYNFGLGSLNMQKRYPKSFKQGTSNDEDLLNKLLTPPQVRMMDKMSETANLNRVSASQKMFDERYSPFYSGDKIPTKAGSEEYDLLLELLRKS